MTTLLLEAARPAMSDRQPAVPAPRVPTLAASVDAAWGQLRARGLAACPVCGGRLQTRLAAGRAGIEGACADCGATLS